MTTTAMLPWHDGQWQRLERSLAEGRLAHALMLGGPEGIGKRQFGETLAARMLCRGEVADRPCGDCPACRQFTAGTHPDMVRLEPAEAGKALGVDAVRDLIERLHLTGGHGTKVGLIDPADALTISAANSVLKTLEEPPPGTYLVLISARPARVPATVRSRCQRIGFGIPPAGQAEEWLAQQGVDRPSPWLALAGGAPLRAHDLAQAESGAIGAPEAVDALLAVLTRQRSAVGAAGKLAHAGLESTVRTWIAAIEDMLRLYHAPDARLRFPDRRTALAEAVHRLDVRHLFDYLGALYRSLPGPSSSLKPAMQIQGLLVDAADIAEHREHGGP